MSIKKEEKTNMTTKNSIKAVIFDVDGVLYSGNSWFSLTEGLGRSIEDHAEIFKQAKTGELGWQRAERKLVAMYQSSGKATKEFITSLCASHQLRPEAKDVIGYLKARGYIICLISGSFNTHVEAVAKQLGIEHWYANSTLVFDQSGNLERIIYYRDQNQVKVNQLIEFCQKVGIEPTECAFIGDSDNDIAVFQLTGHGIAVRCDDEYLKGIAWEECETLTEIKDIL